MSLPLLPLRQQERELQVQKRPESRCLTARPQMLRAESGKNSVSWARCTLKRLALLPAGRKVGGLFHFGVVHSFAICLAQPRNATQLFCEGLRT
jgi:hypothetical protein